MSGPSAKAEQALRRDVLRSDQQSKLRPGEHEPSTMFAMANLDTGVTPSRVGKSDFVSGSQQATDYPAIPSGPWSSSYGRLPDELPLGVAIDAQEPCGEPFEVAASIAALSATASAPVANVVVGTAGVAPSASSPDVAATPVSSSDGASATGPTPEGVQAAYSNTMARGSLHSNLTRPARKL
jgi:hypothetical protein